MDPPTSAVPDQTPLPDLALGKEKSKPSSQLFASVQRQIDSALGGINIIVETIGPWKSIAIPQTLPPGTRNVRAGRLAAHTEQRIRVG